MGGTDQTYLIDFNYCIQTLEKAVKYAFVWTNYSLWIWGARREINLLLPEALFFLASGNKKEFILIENDLRRLCSFMRNCLMVTRPKLSGSSRKKVDRLKAAKHNGHYSISWVFNCSQRSLKQLM